MTNAPKRAPWRTLGFWLAAAIALLQAVNAARAVFDPSGFADYMGLPLAGGADAGWVHVYGLRALFVALAVAALLARGDLRALTWVALAGLVMPLGDFWLTYQTGAPPAIFGRHIAIAVYLLITAIVLVRSARRIT